MRSLLSLFLVVACTAFVAAVSAGVSSRVEPPAAPKPIDPRGGEYPQIMWMVNLCEVKGPIAFDDSGRIVVAANDQAPPSAACRVTSQAHFTADMKVIQAMPGYRFGSVPAVIAKPGADASIEYDAKDKAKASFGDNRLVFRGDLNGERISLQATWFMRDRKGPVLDVRRELAEDGSFIMIAPASGGVWRILVMRPSILRSVDDHPFQTSSSFEGTGASPPKPGVPPASRQ